MLKRNVLRNYYSDGHGGFYLYGMHGWYHVDNRKELNEELRELDSLLSKEVR